MNYKAATRCGVLLFALLLFSLEIPAFSQHTKPVSNSVTIAAHTQYVYKAIQKARNLGGSRRLVSYKNNQAVVEERFNGLPLIGTAKCTYKENETSATRIDYCLIESDTFARFEGSWILTPEKNGSTTVTLTSTTECGLHLPFADRLTTQSAVKRVEKRLREIETASMIEQQLAAQETCLVAGR